MNNNENNLKVTENEKVYTCEDVLKAATKLKDDEKDALFQFYTIPNLVDILNADVHEHCKYILAHAEKVAKVAGAVRKIYNWAKEMDNRIEKEFLENYRDLSDDAKKKVVQELVNDYDYQKNCGEIFVENWDKAVKSNATLAKFDSFISVGKCIKELFDLGLEYERKQGNV